MKVLYKLKTKNNFNKFKTLNACFKDSIDYLKIPAKTFQRQFLIFKLRLKATLRLFEYFEIVHIEVGCKLTNRLNLDSAQMRCQTLLFTFTLKISKKQVNHYQRTGFFITGTFLQVG